MALTASLSALGDIEVGPALIPSNLLVIHSLKGIVGE